MKNEWLENYMGEAERLIVENRTVEGLDLLQGLLYEEPGYGPLHNHLGWAYLYYSTDVERAELHLKMAMKFAPDFPAPYLHMGQLMIRLGRYAEAIHALEGGIKKPDANQVAFQESLGRAWEMRSEFGKAKSAYKKALLASMSEHEMSGLQESIKRCRKKSWVLFFSL